MEKYGISEIPVIPVRSEPSEKSEMVTQILFGEMFKIFNKMGNWLEVESVNDNYRGWIDSKTATIIEESFLTRLKDEPIEILKNVINKIKLIDTNTFAILPFGSSLPCFNNVTGDFFINSINYRLLNPLENKDLSITEYALSFINSPYLWGGRNPFGIDCSGLVQVVYKACGINLPRDASQQVNRGRTIEFQTEIKPGDLAFFDNDEGNIIHVGILLSKNEIIHSSGKVRIDSIDHQGIYNKELKSYTHKLRIIKRIKE